MAIEIDLPPGGMSFRFTIRPEEVTDDRLGITLSSRVKDGEIIAPVYEEGWQNPSVVRAFKFDEYPAVNGKAITVQHTYRGITGNVDGNNVSARNHPHMIEIMTAAANWSTALVAARRKPTA